MTDMKIAESVIAEAASTIFKKRPGLHGNAEDSFQMIAHMWSAYVHHVFSIQDSKGEDRRLEPAHVAQMMVQLKQCRALYGDPANPDNFVDAVGYSALAGALQLSPHIKIEQQMEKTDAVQDQAQSI